MFLTLAFLRDGEAKGGWYLRWSQQGESQGTNERTKGQGVTPAERVLVSSKQCLSLLPRDPQRKVTEAIMAP